jgi:hypothetical protein
MTSLVQIELARERNFLAMRRKEDTVFNITTQQLHRSFRELKNFSDT